VQLLDDDDRLLPGKLSKTAAVLDKNPDIGVAYCGVIEQGTGPVRPKPEVTGDIIANALRFRTYPVWTGSMLIRRTVLCSSLPLAGMGEDVLDVPLGDSDLKIALARRTQFEAIDECLVFYRRESSRRWTGEKRFQKIRQTVAHRRELYAQYPQIRRAVLAEWSRKRGRYYLETDRPPAEPLACYAKWAYHASSYTVREAIRALSSTISRRVSTGVSA